MKTEFAAYLERADHKYIHVVEIDGEKAKFSNPNQTGTLIVASGSMNDLFEPDVWGFIVDVPEGVYRVNKDDGCVFDFAEHQVELFPNAAS